MTAINYSSSNAIRIAALREAVASVSPIRGLTHQFYRYPARFAPAFASTCIEHFSSRGDVVLDPHMGGGTVVVEAMIKGRKSIGSDLNSLAVFIARVKTTPLTPADELALRNWSSATVLALKGGPRMTEIANSAALRNMSLPNTRWIRRFIAHCLESTHKLPSPASQDFARCVLLNTGQWALNGRRRSTTVAEFREKVAVFATDMLTGVVSLKRTLEDATWYSPTLLQTDVEQIHLHLEVNNQGPVDLVVTSPPYPGIHMLYHRWQVDGRKESNAPYWIAACTDGSGASYYNYADRRRRAEQEYFEKANRGFSAIRSVMKPGAVLAQIVAFSNRKRQLPKYLDCMEAAGFKELRLGNATRIWRDVPGRKWHAHSKGTLSSAREVVLLHEAS